MNIYKNIIYIDGDIGKASYRAVLDTHYIFKNIYQQQETALILPDTKGRIVVSNIGGGVVIIRHNNVKIYELQFNESAMFIYVIDKWYQVKKIEMNPLFANFHKGYIFGGDSGLTRDDCDEYNTFSDTWETKSHLLYPTSDAGASTIKNKGYMYGGQREGYNLHHYIKCDEYDAVLDAWIAKTNMPVPSRQELAASTIFHKGYVYAGWHVDSPNVTLQDCDEYDPDIWTSKTDLPAPGRSKLAASTILDKGYIYGGYGNGTGITSRLRDCDEYDNNTWTSKTDIPTPGRYELTASTISDKGYIYGGKSDDPIQNCDEYNSTTDAWTSQLDMTSSRYRLAASTINDKGYVYGGRGESSGENIATGRECTCFDLAVWTEKNIIPNGRRERLAAVTI